jgi:hypothetical protein
MPGSIKGWRANCSTASHHSSLVFSDGKLRPAALVAAVLQACCSVRRMLSLVGCRPDWQTACKAAACSPVLPIVWDKGRRPPPPAQNLRPLPSAKVAQSATKPSAGGMPRWLYGSAAVVVLAILAYWLWGTGGVQEASRTPANTSAQTEGSGTSTAVGQIDLGPQLSRAFDNTRSVLEQVNDPESAKRALPQLGNMNAQLDKLLEAAAQAPDQQKKIVVDVATKAQPVIQSLMDKALAKPGVADVLKPTLDAFKSKLAALASA